jgi:hypothetical protein
MATLGQRLRLHTNQHHEQTEKRKETILCKVTAHIIQLKLFFQSQFALEETIVKLLFYPRSFFG